MSKLLEKIAAIVSDNDAKKMALGNDGKATKNEMSKFKKHMMRVKGMDKSAGERWEAAKSRAKKEAKWKGKVGAAGGSAAGAYLGGKTKGPKGALAGAALGALTGGLTGAAEGAADGAIRGAITKKR